MSVSTLWRCSTPAIAVKRRAIRDLRPGDNQPGQAATHAWCVVTVQDDKVPCRELTRHRAVGFQLYQEPVLGMLVHGSAGGSALPACSSSMEMPSGVRTKAMRPSRGGRLIMTPRAMKALQVS